MPTVGTDMSYCRYRHALPSVPTATTIGTSDAMVGTGFPDHRYHLRYRWYRRSDSRYHTRYRWYHYLRELVPSSADYRYRWHRTFGTICSDSKYRKGRLPNRAIRIHIDTSKETDASGPHVDQALTGHPAQALRCVRHLRTKPIQTPNSRNRLSKQRFRELCLFVYVTIL